MYTLQRARRDQTMDTTASKGPFDGRVLHTTYPFPFSWFSLLSLSSPVRQKARDLAKIQVGGRPSEEEGRATAAADKKAERQKSFHYSSFWERQARTLAVRVSTVEMLKPR